MTIRHKTFVLANASAALVAGALAGTAMAADLSLRSHVGSQTDSHSGQTLPATKRAIITEKKTKGDSGDVTGTIEWPASARASLTPATAAISHTYSARASFAKARAAMESGILLREDVPKPNFASLEAATGDVLSELKALELVTQTHRNDTIRRAITLVQDWHETGLKIIKPPAEGVTALPFPATVAAKANAVSTALDQLIEQAIAVTAPNGSRQRSDLQVR
jgi:hypothetical protein